MATQPNLNTVSSSAMSLADSFTFLKRDVKLEINAHHIGKIESFDPLLQTAKVSINYVKTFLAQDGVGKSFLKTTNYPTIVDAPCIFLGGGGALGASLTFPIKSGDSCFVLFNDRDIDNWFSGSDSSSPATSRLHSFSDAVVLVGGPRSLPNVIKNYDADAATLQYGLTSVKVFSDKVVIKMGATATITATATSVLWDLGAGVTMQLSASGKFKVTNPMGELISAMEKLMQDIQNATTTTMLGPMPLVMPTFPTDLAILSSFKG